MSDARHTPGPWDCDGLEVSVYGRGIIAQCPTARTGGAFECMTNARLIAAAPDLLAALQTVLSVRMIDNLTSEQYASVHAAIAKATQSVQPEQS